MSFVVPNASKIGGIWETCLESFSGTPEFQFLVTLIMNNLLFLKSVGTPKSIIFLFFLKVALGSPPETDFLRFCSIWGSPGEAIWLQNGVHTGSVKKFEKRVF